MGKVLNAFGNGSPGAVTRSVDEIVISVRNASEGDIPFGTPVFLAEGGAVPFSLDAPQDFASFLGFAVRVADKTPDIYPAGQFNDPPEGAWHAGDVMEVLVRGGIAVRTAASVYPQIRRRADRLGRGSRFHGAAGERPHPQSPDRRGFLLRGHRQQTQPDITMNN